MKRRRALLSFVVAQCLGAFVLGAPPLAHADFEMQISTTSNPSYVVTVHDNGSGFLAYSGSIGAFTINVDTGLSKPIQGSAASPDMDLNFVVAKLNNSQADAITIKITDTDFTASAIPLHMQAGGTFSGSITSVFNQASFDPSNKLFGTGGGSASQLFTSSPYSGTVNLGATGADDYSLTEVVTITSGMGGGSASGDSELMAPAPAGLVLALTGMPILGIGGWLRRRPKTTA